MSAAAYYVFAILPKMQKYFDVKPIRDPFSCQLARPIRSKGQSRERTIVFQSSACHGSPRRTWIFRVLSLMFMRMSHTARLQRLVAEAPNFHHDTASLKPTWHISENRRTQQGQSHSVYYLTQLGRAIIPIYFSKGFDGCGGAKWLSKASAAIASTGVVRIRCCHWISVCDSILNRRRVAQRD